MGKMGRVNRLPNERYECARCEQTFEDEEVRNTWKCPKCDGYISVYAEDAETDTRIVNTDVKMYQLVNFDTKFILVASERRKGIFTNRINKEPFAKEKHKFSFRSFEDVGKLYFSSVEHYELKSKFVS